MLVSIITINYNNKDGLRKTIESVINQNYNSFEFIVIDGGSTDGSLEVIQEYKMHIDYWVSEPDKGIYNAMNKGIAKAHGKYCNFMNSGDCFADNNVLNKVFRNESQADIICGNTYWVKWTKPPKEITLDNLFNGTICHQCAFINRMLLLKYKYDENLKIVADRKFFLQSLIFENCSYKSVDVDIVIYDLNGFSSNNQVLSDLEYQHVLSELIPERIRKDYGKKYKGVLYGDTYYEKLFFEIGKRNYRNYIYTMVVFLMRIIALFINSAKFINLYPLKLK